MSMARYSAFLGRTVEVHYRAGDILLPASGTFVGDSGRSIFLEQHLIQRGQQKHFRWEIPYQYIVNLEEKPPAAGATSRAEAALPQKSNPESARETATRDTAPKPSSAELRNSDDAPIVPLHNRPKTA